MEERERERRKKGERETFIIRGQRDQAVVASAGRVSRDPTLR